MSGHSLSFAPMCTHHQTPGVSRESWSTMTQRKDRAARLVSGVLRSRLRTSPGGDADLRRSWTAALKIRAVSPNCNTAVTPHAHKPHLYAVTPNDRPNLKKPAIA